MIYSKLIVDVNVSAWQYFTVALALALAPFLVLPCLLTKLSVNWLYFMAYLANRNGIELVHARAPEVLD